MDIPTKFLLSRVIVVFKCLAFIILYKGNTFCLNNIQ